MEQFNKLNQMHDFAETQFALNVGEGPKVENVPTTIEDVVAYTDVTLPAMKPQRSLKVEGLGIQMVEFMRKL